MKCKPGLTHVAWHEIDTCSAVPAASKPYKYEKVKQGIIGYRNNKMLSDDIIIRLLRRQMCCVGRTVVRVQMIWRHGSSEFIIESKMLSHSISSIRFRL